MGLGIIPTNPTATNPVTPLPSTYIRPPIARTHLDTLITAETQKHAALKTHKTGLMQQLFPSPEEPTRASP